MKLLLLVCLLLAASAALAQEEPDGEGEVEIEVIVEEVLPAEEVIESPVDGVSLSPDGTMLAGFTPYGICITMIDASEETCHPFPINFAGQFGRKPLQNPLRWSPDSQQIAFTESIYTFLFESDIWVLNPFDGMFTNLTDDGIIGAFTRLEVDNFMLDYMPAWAPDGTIYFFRSQRTPTSRAEYTLALMRLAPGSAEPELIIDLTGLLPAFSVYYHPAVSTDGRWLVFPLHWEVDTTFDGLWIIDLETGFTRQLLPMPVLNTGQPAWEDRPLTLINNPVWVNDNTGILARLDAEPEARPLVERAYIYVFIETGEVQPLIDFSAIDSPEALLTAGDDGAFAPIRLAPREGAVHADRQSFLYLGYGMNQEAPALFVLPLPPAGSAPVEVMALEGTLPTVRYVPNPILSERATGLLQGLFIALASREE